MHNCLSELWVRGIGSATPSRQPLAPSRGPAGSVSVWPRLGKYTAPLRFLEEIETAHGLPRITSPNPWDHLGCFIAPFLASPERRLAPGTWSQTDQWLAEDEGDGMGCPRPEAAISVSPLWSLGRAGGQPGAVPASWPSVQRRGTRVSETLILSPPRGMADLHF